MLPSKTLLSKSRSHQDVGPELVSKSFLENVSISYCHHDLTHWKIEMKAVYRKWKTYRNFVKFFLKVFFALESPIVMLEKCNLCQFLHNKNRDSSSSSSSRLYTNYFCVKCDWSKILAEKKFTYFSLIQIHGRGKMQQNRLGELKESLIKIIFSGEISRENVKLSCVDEFSVRFWFDLHIVLAKDFCVNLTKF